MKHTTWWMTWLLLAGCAPDHVDEPVPEPAAAESDESGHAIAIPSSVQRNLGITFATVEARRVAQTIRVPGAFELQPLARHEYRMSLSGRVDVLVDQYEEVETGSVLFRFQSPKWPELLHEIIVGEQAMETAKAEIAVALARLEEAEQVQALTRERIEALARADFKRADLEAAASEAAAGIPRLRAELELARTRLANAERTREHALHRAATASGFTERELEAEVDRGGVSVPTYQTIDWIEVRALEGGIVESLAVTDGAFVEPAAVILTTVEPDRVRFRALALQSDLPKFLHTQAVRIVPPRSPGLAVDDSVEADMSFGLEAHPEERTMTLIAVPRAVAEWVRPGVSAFLEVEVESSDGPALAVPSSAIVQDGLQHIFFRRNPSNPNEALRTEADLGVSDGRWVVLQSGVMRGDQVVLDGVYELKLALQDGGAGPTSGHVHADGTSHDDH